MGRWLAAGALRGAGAIILDRDGNRFVDELGHRDHVTGRMWKHNKAPYRLILNGASAKKIAWHCEHYKGRGLMKEYHGTAQLAQDMGVSTDTLARTFAQYTKTGEECKAKQTKDQFGKEPYNFFSLPWQPNDTFFVAEIGP